MNGVWFSPGAAAGDLRPQQRPLLPAAPPQCDRGEKSTKTKDAAGFNPPDAADRGQESHDHSGGGQGRSQCGSGPSQSSVVVCGRGRLQDALSIGLHQGAPLHLPGQQQVFAVQRVDELHLHRRSEVRGTGSPQAGEEALSGLWAGREGVKVCVSAGL